MHDRIANRKIYKAYLVGFAAGCLFSILLASILPAQAHNCENDDIECGYEWVYTEDGEEVSQYVCR